MSDESEMEDNRTPTLPPWIEQELLGLVDAAIRNGHSGSKRSMQRLDIAERRLREQIAAALAAAPPERDRATVDDHYESRCKCDHWIWHHGHKGCDRLGCSCTAFAAAVLAAPPESQGADAHAAMQDDIAAALRALGISDHARPLSPHEVMVCEVIPGIENLRGQLASAEQSLRERGA